MSAATTKIVDLIRKHGTERTLSAFVDPEKNGVSVAVTKILNMLVKLIYVLEQRHVLRRGHVVGLICAAEGIPEDKTHDQGD